MSFAGQQTAPVTLRLTIHQPRAGSAVVAEGSLSSDQTCSFADDLDAAASGRLTLISGSFSGDADCSRFAAVRQVITASSASSATVTVVVPAVDQADSASTLTGTLVRG
ncbi:hypothetical protein ABH920_000665 [Catenulispora sp. EB89]|uniref:hypothetical protein n=1 Tax=Catenulispora sp. EB89 TaxID=3156257 RepID=UPI00351891AD